MLRRMNVSRCCCQDTNGEPQCRSTCYDTYNGCSLSANGDVYLDPDDAFDNCGWEQLDVGAAGLRVSGSDGNFTLTEGSASLQKTFNWNYKASPSIYFELDSTVPESFSGAALAPAQTAIGIIIAPRLYHYGVTPNTTNTAPQVSTGSWPDFGSPAVTSVEVGETATLKLEFILGVVLGTGSEDLPMRDESVVTSCYQDREYELKYYADDVLFYTLEGSGRFYDAVCEGNVDLALTAGGVGPSTLVYPSTANADVGTL